MLTTETQQIMVSSKLDPTQGNQDITPGGVYDGEFSSRRHKNVWEDEEEEEEYY